MESGRIPLELFSRDSVGSIGALSADDEEEEVECMFRECVRLKILRRVGEVESTRERLGGGDPVTSSSELEVASIAKNLMRNDA